MNDDSNEVSIYEPVIEKAKEKQSIPPQPVIEKTSTKEKATVSLEAVLDRVVGRGKAANQNVTTNSEASSRPKTANARSKAEQELLDMIRAGIKG